MPIFTVICKRCDNEFEIDLDTENICVVCGMPFVWTESAYPDVEDEIEDDFWPFEDPFVNRVPSEDEL